MMSTYINNLLCMCVMKFGGERYESVERVPVNCTVLDGVVCAGDTTFTKQDAPCVR